MDDTDTVIRFIEESGKYFTAEGRSRFGKNRGADNAGYLNVFSDTRLKV